MSRSPRTPAKTIPNATIRCAIYTRKSSEEGLAQEFNSLDAQRESAESYIASQKAEGWVALPERYDDGGYSGGSMERPALAKLITDIDAGKVDCVVVYKVDRLSRSLLDFARIMETFDKHRVSFVSVTQHFNTTHSMGRLTLNILLSFAQFEREIIGERIRDKIAAQRKKGQWAGGWPVLGYDVDRSGPSPKLYINAAEAQQVRAIFSLYLEKSSLLPVVQELALRGWRNKDWKTKAGKPRPGQEFNKATLYGFLTNPIFVGKIRHKALVYDGQHPSIVEPEVFAQVQTLLQHNGHTGGHEARNKHGALLRGLLYCKTCGLAMVHTFTTKGDKQYRYYACLNAIKKGYASCPAKSLPAGEIERVVVEQIRDIGKDPELLAEVLGQARAGAEEELAVLERSRQELTRELGRHHSEIRKLAADGDTSNATTARIADLHQRISDGESRAAQIAQEAAELQLQQVTESDLGALGDFDTIWKTLSPREQIQVLGLLIGRVDYNAEAGAIAVQFHTTGIKTLHNQLTEAA